MFIDADVWLTISDCPDELDAAITAARLVSRSSPKSSCMKQFIEVLTIELHFKMELTHQETHN
jgi:hypothetical protein